MLSVERIHTDISPYKTVSTIPATNRDISMVGSSITSSDPKSKSVKKHTLSGKFLDNDTLLVILNTVLKTQQRTVTTEVNISTDNSLSSQSKPSHRNLSTCNDSRTAATTTLSHQKQSQSESKRLIQKQQLAELDCKIEKAMDSVKIELLSTVRKEVRQLQSQVRQLQTHNQILEQENRILRSAAAPETLAKLNSLETSPPCPITPLSSS